MARRSHFKAASRTQMQKNKKRLEFFGLFLLALGLLVLYCVLFPSGIWGRKIKGTMGWLFGIERFVFPLWVSYVGLRLASSKPWPQLVLRFSLWAGFFLFSTTLASLFGKAAFQLNYGGIIGLTGFNFFSKLFGVPGAWLVALLGVGLTVSGLCHVSPIELIEKLKQHLKDDFKEWKTFRQKKTTQRPPVVPPRPLSEGKPLSEPIISKPVLVSPDAKKETNSLLTPSAPSITIPASKNKMPPVKKDTKKTKSFLRSSSKESSTSSETDQPSDSQKTEVPYQLPPMELLEGSTGGNVQQSESDLRVKAKLLEKTLANFSVTARVTDIHPGPVITRYDLEPAPGVKISSIVSLADDIALAMKATRIRVLAPIPGKGAVGIEIPNSQKVTVTLKEILMDIKFQETTSPLSVGLGKTSSGEPYATDLAPMPHILVAGSTGSGKSVCIHSLIMSILMKAKPDQVKFLMIDPKRLELTTYDGLPHLYDPRGGANSAQVITQPKEASKALARMVQVMEYRYELFADANVRNIEGYNEKRISEGLPPEYYIVVIIDELADLMLVSAKEVENCIQRLAQMARAVGIHLVLATQRPSVDVITGVIKANLPARVAFRVASQMDSRVILDTIGAESLVGSGDMLFLPTGAPSPIRLQGAFVSQKEVQSVVAFAKEQSKPNYEDIFASMAAHQAAQQNAESQAELNEGLRLVMERKRVSQDLLKAHFGSSAKASNVLSLLEVRGFINKPMGTNRWEIYFDKIEDYFRATSSKS